MSSLADLTATPVRDGATVMLVRDGQHTDRRLEVLMLRRHPSTAFGAIWAFPGGVVDPSDALGGDTDLAHDPDHDPAHDDASASRRLGLDAGGGAFWAAALRETAEETGLQLRAGDLHYFSHWITPPGAPKRYDTRFFVALAPDAQHVHDAREHTDSTWIRPVDALARHAAGGFEMILPTIRNLEAIGRFARASDLLDAAAATTDPRAVDDGGGWRILLPGDPGQARTRA
jgi:8-oxo-dGTP pyrophosphatase MutT (NUDIX family)